MINVGIKNVIKSVVKFVLLAIKIVKIYVNIANVCKNALKYVYQFVRITAPKSYSVGINALVYFIFYNIII